MQPNAPDQSWRWQSGQALLEFALATPVLFLALLGFCEAGFALGDQAAQGRATATIADYAAGRPGDESWHAVANLELPGCDVAKSEPLPGVVAISSSCAYQPRLLPGLWPDLHITSSESAAVDPEPTESPAP